MPRYPRLSPAGGGLSAQVYTGLLALAQASGRELFPLHVGDTYREPPECASVTALAHARTPGLHRYADVRGEPRLLDAIVAELARRDRSVERNAIQVTAGATSGLDLVCRTLLTPGDEVLVLAPHWPLIRGVISACGARPVELPFFTELGRPDFDPERTLEAALSERTVAVYVNSPNNPTGQVLSAELSRWLAGFIERHDLWLLSDEAYERLDYEESSAPPLWRHERVRGRALVAHTLSKSYGLAGARIGYVHGPEAVVGALAGLQTFTTYCAARPMQLAASEALSSPEGEQWLAEAREAYRSAAHETARALGIAPPASGTFVFFDLRPHLRSGESAQELLARVASAGVVLTPGTAAGTHYAEWARLCFTAVPPAALTRALATLSRVLYA